MQSELLFANWWVTHRSATECITEQNSIEPIHIRPSCRAKVMRAHHILLACCHMILIFK